MSFANEPGKYEEKVQRMQTAIKGGIPDRLPSLALTMTWGFGYSETNIEQVYHNREKHIQGATDFLKDIYMDSLFIPCLDFPYGFTEILNPPKPQYRINPDGFSMQHIENSPMEPDEYPKLAEDPRSFIANEILPRRYPALNEPYPKNYELLKKCYDEEMYFLETMMAGIDYVKNTYGTPCFSGGVHYVAPDMCFDFFRGFKGFILDIRRKQDKMKEALWALNDYEYAVKDNLVKKDAVQFIPLHVATYLNEKLYDEYYFPYLKAYCDKIIEKGGIPCLYLEGDWTCHLDSLKEFPKNSISIIVESGDMKHFKDTVGDHISIIGGMPCSKLRDCSVEESLDYAKKQIDILAPGGGYIFAVDKLLLSRNDINPENYKAVVEYIRDNCKY